MLWAHARGGRKKKTHHRRLAEGGAGERAVILHILRRVHDGLQVAENLEVPVRDPRPGLPQPVHRHVAEAGQNGEH